nr:13583_t:CDS:2 [Entrophospora candida]
MLEILLSKRPRKSEPVSVVIFRKFVVILFVLIALVVLVILSIGVNNDTPTITRKYSQMDKFPVPDSGVDGTNNEYVNQPTYDSNGIFLKGSFLPDNLSFVIGDVNKTQNQGDINSLILIVEITDPSYNATSHSSIYLSVSMRDQEYDPFNDTLANGTDDYSTFVKSLQEDVLHSIGNDYALASSRKKRTVLKDSPLNDLGLPQKYPEQPYVVTNDRSIGTAENTKSSKFIITPQSFLLETEVEQSIHLIKPSSLIILGSDSIKPWGFIQERILKNETRNKLMSAPFFKKEGTPEERIEALETFLKDHVVDVSLIDQSNKSSYQKINPSS